MIIGGESFVSSSPAFSNDAKNLLVCTGNTVSIFSIFTGMQIMELEGHKAPVTSVIVVPTATLGCKILCNCWTSSLDGTICYWDFSLPELIKKVDVNLPIFSMVIPHFSSLPLETNEKLRIHCAFVSVEDVKAPSDKPKASHGQIRMVDLNKARMVGGPLQEVALTQVTLSKDGSLMGTVEVKLPEEGIGGLVSLKFWAYGSCSRVYSLSTVIYEPHSEAGISDLAFHPSRSMAMSSSFGGDLTDFTIWVHSHIYQQKDQNPGWRCQSVGSYKKQPMTAAVFSPDGSVLAVAAETVVTLWNPDTNVLVAVIGETLMPIVTLSFVGKSEHLVSLSRGSNPQLSVGNMSALSISWSYKLHAEAVACSSNSSHFAVLALAPEAYKQFESVEVALESGDGVILLFDAENPIPNFTWFAKKANGGGLAFLEANPSPHLLIIYEQFGYASIYGELPEFKTKRDQIASIPFVPSDKPWETIFSGSSHALPPLSKLCLTFLSSLLEKRTTVQQ